MPITYAGACATLDGDCAIEEAEPLLDWLRRHPAATVDLAGCTHLHAAILQTLLAAAPAIAAPPRDPLLAHLLVQRTP